MRSKTTVGLLALGLSGLLVASPALGAQKTTKKTAKTTKTTKKGPATTKTGAPASSTPAAPTTNASNVNIGAAATATGTCPADRKGGSLTVGTGTSLIYGVSPYTVLGSGQVGGDYMSAMFDTIMRYDARKQEFTPNLAESLKSNANFTEWTLKLKPNIKFGNGDTMSSEDVKAHIENLQRSVVRAAGMAAGIRSMTIVDPLTIVFNVGDPWGMFPYVLATEPGWVPNRRLVTERTGSNNIRAVAGFALNAAGAGAGAYEFVSFKANEEIVLKAKANYWRGSACIENLRFRNVPGADASYEAFQKKELDTLFIFNVRVAAKVRDANLMDYEVPVGGLRYVVADQGITGATKTPFMDVRIREAMQLAINYDVLNQRLYDNKTPVTDGAIVPKGSPVFHGVAGPATDNARARTLVAQTIQDGTWDGSFNFLHEATPDSTNEALALKALWEAAGMNVNLEVVPSVGTRVIAERKFQVATNGFAVADPAPWTTLNGLATGSVRQRTGFSNREMDAALIRLRAADTIDETKKALAEMQTVWNKTFPVVVIGHSVWGSGVQPNVKGATYGADNTLYLDTAYIAK